MSDATRRWRFRYRVRHKWPYRTIDITADSEGEALGKVQRDLLPTTPGLCDLELVGSAPAERDQK